ncbi:hypothetical protein D1013_08395 [Euzebyella marina]|uniref:Uncharacterized protein n=1 Tax=Euzebyella marina TaxID=1761453 RepID=A0A3G2L547_9FLAO|nr:hypothetical protein D1013_08395 [Euzebyella marina]
MLAHCIYKQPEVLNLILNFYLRGQDKSYIKLLLLKVIFKDPTQLQKFYFLLTPKDPFKQYSTGWYFFHFEVI